MPVSGGGFDQAYNVQTAVDTATRLVLATGVTQQTNDKQQVEPMLEALGRLPASLGRIDSAAMDNGYFSAANIQACLDREIEPLSPWAAKPATDATSCPDYVSEPPQAASTHRTVERCA